MKTPQVTKEQLVIELAKLRDSHAGWVTGDERRRKEFAKAFGWTKPWELYPADNEVSTPSWEQIFVQVGKLLVLEELKQKVILSPLPFIKDL